MNDKTFAPRMALILATAAVAACAGQQADEERRARAEREPAGAPVGVIARPVRDADGRQGEDALADRRDSAVATPTAQDVALAAEHQTTGQREAGTLAQSVDESAAAVAGQPQTTSLPPASMPQREEISRVLKRGLPLTSANAQLSIAPTGANYQLAPADPLDRENYAHVESNPVKLVAEEPVSTLSIDVDTGSYANVRRFLSDGRLPPQNAVRVEEMVNYFSYDYPLPNRGDAPFSVTTELARTPWNPDTVLMQIGIKGYEIAAAERAPANLVFLLDVSGSMNQPDKLPLLKNAFRLVTGQLDDRDRVSIVVYAGSSGVVLEPTRGDDHAAITAALERLGAGGSTNGAAGIRQAYQIARSVMVAEGINRVVLATDGDFNVGTVNFEALLDLVETNRDSGVSLTTLGFGTGNYNDKLMERLADAGNGNYAYIDTLNEARKVLVEELSSTLQTIASDVKIQIEFNPATVAEYRLIGYENRLLNREDFNNDAVDAGEIGAGHTVTALYELALTGSAGALVDPLRYAAQADTVGNADELAFLKLRYKAPASDTSTLLTFPIERRAIVDATRTSENFRFAAAVAAFGQQLAGSAYVSNFDYSRVSDLARSGRGTDRFGYRAEFVSLVELAAALDTGSDRPVRISAERQ